jgi:glycine amidinotransferase
MIKVNNTYSKLKTCVVGKELDIPKRYIDETFKYFYSENLNRGLYNVYAKKCGYSEYTINKEILDIRREQLDNLAKILENNNVKVYRPKDIKTTEIKTNNFNSYSSIASNVRDLTFVYKNYIIETPVFIRNRIFENE